MNAWIARNTITTGRVLICALLVFPIGIKLFLANSRTFMMGGSTRLNTCIANLKQIDNAKEQWAMDHHKPVGDLVTYKDLVGETLYLKVRPVCPSGQKYVLGRVGAIPICLNPSHKR